MPVNLSDFGLSDFRFESYSAGFRTYPIKAVHLPSGTAIDLRGMTKKQAAETLKQFLDDQKK